MNMIWHHNIHRDFHIILTNNGRLFDLCHRIFTNLRQFHFPIHHIPKKQFAVFRAKRNKIIRTCIIVPSGTGRFTLGQVVWHGKIFCKSTYYFRTRQYPQRKTFSADAFDASLQRDITVQKTTPTRGGVGTHRVCPPSPKKHCFADVFDDGHIQ